MSANVGDQLNAMLRSNQGSTACFLGQGVVVPDVWDGQLMAHITRTLLKNGFQLALKQRFIKIA
jgi:hypothetical protein